MPAVHLNGSVLTLSTARNNPRLASRNPSPSSWPACGRFVSLRPPRRPAQPWPVPDRPARRPAPPAATPHDAGMVPLDPSTSAGIAGSDELFGPTAMLLVGFSPAETQRVAFLLESLGATDHVRLVTATAVTLAGTLRDALEQRERHVPSPSPVPPTTPRAVFLSGFYSGEVVDVIGAWRDTPDLPEPVWAAAVPNNYDGVVGELVQAVAADDAAMQARRMGGGE